MPRSSLVDAFLAQVRRQPDAGALVWHDEEISYRVLEQMAQRQRRRLTRLTDGMTEPVAVLAHKSPEGVALILACLLDGRQFLLLSPATPSAAQRSAN